jgi:hypothetical protein
VYLVVPPGRCRRKDQEEVVVRECVGRTTESLVRGDQSVRAGLRLLVVGQERPLVGTREVSVIHDGDAAVGLERIVERRGECRIVRPDTEWRRRVGPQKVGRDPSGIENALLVHRCEGRPSPPSGGARRRQAGVGVPNRHDVHPRGRGKGSGGGVVSRVVGQPLQWLDRENLDVFRWRRRDARPRGSTGCAR